MAAALSFLYCFFMHFFRDILLFRYYGVVISICSSQARPKDAPLKHYVKVKSLRVGDIHARESHL